MAKEIFVAYGIDVDAVAGWLGSYGGQDSPSDISRGLFAGEVGVPRILKLLERFGITQTWFVPGHSIETFPAQIEQIVKAGHEIGLHGYSHENPLSMSPEQEEEVLAYCIELIRTATGRDPRGYVAPWWEISATTPSLLVKYGIQYDHSLMHHDFQPYYLRIGDTWTKIDYTRPAREWMKPLVRGRDSDIVEIPASWHLDDMEPFLYIKAFPNTQGFANPRDIEARLRDMFDWVYKEYDYAIFPMTIHPDVSGHPEVLMLHERLIPYFLSHPGVRFPTYGEIADDFRRRSPRSGPPVP
jgi:peptidoglycan/xylan/chitin deacetylase (PgdA/CDA1 family)